MTMEMPGVPQKKGIIAPKIYSEADIQSEAERLNNVIQQKERWDIEICKTIAPLTLEINNLKNPDSIKVGDKLLLTKKNPISSENDQIIEKKKNNEFLELDRQIYGPLIIQNKSYKKIKGRKILNVINQKNKKLILSVNCDTDELDVRIPGRKWRGGEPAKEEFEKKLINDFC